MYRIGKRFRFEAGHSLPSLPDGHKCQRPHGHSYQVEVILENRSLNEHDFVLDYAALNVFKTMLDQAYDHRELNEVLRLYYAADIPTTAENLARHFHQRVKLLLGAKIRTFNVTVRVKETDSTFAEYYE